MNEDLLREARDKCYKLRRDRLAITRAYVDVKKECDKAREVLREIQAADWKTSGELRGMARRALGAAK